MTTHNNSDVEVIKKWWAVLSKELYRQKPSHLSESSLHLMSQLKHAEEQKQWIKAWDLIERVKYLTEKGDYEEKAEVYLNCAMIAVEMGAYKEAESLLRESELKYQNIQHNYSIVAWLLGCVEWILPGKQNEAILNWQRSLAGFKKLKDKETDKGNADWYSNLCDELKSALQKSIEEDKIAPPSANMQRDGLGPKDRTQGGDQAESKSNSDPTSPKSSKSSKPPDLLYLFPVVDEIPASGFGAMGFDPYQKGSVEADEFVINGKLYRMIRLKNQGRVNIAAREHFVVLVEGNSMNNAGIDSGDYVLLRCQNTAEIGDIVAAAMLGRDSTATLKYYSRSDPSVILKPKSKDPSHRDITIMEKDETENDGKFTIVGVVIAVLKPL